MQMLKIRPARLGAKLTDVHFISSMYFMRHSSHSAQPSDPIIYIIALRCANMLPVIFSIFNVSEDTASLLTLREKN